MHLFFLSFFLSFFIAETGFSFSFKQKHYDPFLLKLTDSTSVALLVSATGAVFIVRPGDEETRAAWKNNQQLTKSQSHLGDLLGTGGMGLILSAGQYIFDENPNHYQSHLRSLAYTTVGIYTLKFAFSRQRPGGSRNYQSFPSGHTATAFATATTLTYVYGWPMGLIAFPVATFVSLSRLADDVHWGSDIVGGAFLGFIVGRASTYEVVALENALDSAAAAKLYFYPVLDPDKHGAGLTYLF